MATISGQPGSASSLTQLIGASSPQQILSKLTTLCTNRQWLPPSHIYANVVSALQGNAGINGAPLAEYIAYSIPLHVADGWVFLARAFDAIKAGDRRSAVHMAYYAELRAAMSLLASEGVGIFRNRHVAIGHNYVTADFSGPGTHVATWKLMEAWGNDPHRSSTVLDAITVEQRTINEWFDEANVSSSVQHLVAGDWLKEWSIDLSIFFGDRNLRNEVSYQPSRIIQSTSAAAVKAQVIDPLLRAWDPLQPSSDRGGALIDQDLLALALSRARDRQNLSQLQWEQFVDQHLPAASYSLRAYLKSPQSGAHDIFTWAQDASVPPKVNAVLSRATLLLRIANAVCALKLDQAHVMKDDLRFWWDSLGQDCGYWTPGDEPDTFAELWTDVSNAIGDIDVILQTYGSPITMSESHQVMGPAVSLTQHPRALFWLLGLDR